MMQSVPDKALFPSTSRVPYTQSPPAPWHSLDNKVACVSDLRHNPMLLAMARKGNMARYSAFVTDLVAGPFF
jgi:hypothetical protein